LTRPLRNQPTQPRPGVRRAVCRPRPLNPARPLVNSPRDTQNSSQSSRHHHLSFLGGCSSLSSSRTMTSSVATSLSTSQSFIHPTHPLDIPKDDLTRKKAASRLGMPSARMSILGGRSLTDCFAPLSFWLGTPRLGDSVVRPSWREAGGGLRHFITPLLGRGAIIAIRRKGTLQRKGRDCGSSSLLKYMKQSAVCSE
jgi:hypothetical protein